MWIVFGILFIIIILAVLGGAGFFGPTSDPGQTRKGGGGNFIDWLF